MAKDFTVAICTRNRADFLQKCLDGLFCSDQKIKPTVIIVDNNSTDSTCDIIAQFSGKVDSFIEKNVGLSHARNTAIANCHTPYLVFLDDDGIPDPEWAVSIQSMIDEHEPDVFGGPYSPFYTDPKEPWFSDTIGAAHADLSDGLQPWGTCFSGGNMGWRVELLKALGGFDPKLGISGNELRLGEETALQLAIWHRFPDAKFSFARKMHMTHHVSKMKMRLSYIHKRNFIYGWQLPDIDPNQEILKDGIVPLILRTKLGAPLVWRYFVRNRTVYPYWKGYAAAYLSLNSILAGVAARKLSDLWTRKAAA